MCAKFQLNWYTYSCFIAENSSLRNEEKEGKKPRAKNEIEEKKK